MAVSCELVTLEQVLAARRRLEGVALRTPVETSRAVSEAAGKTTLLKCEHLQRTGSFKIRGAYNRIARLTPGERARGVVCASAGNHAQGVALSASLLGMRSTVFMPADAPLPKVEATRGYGAAVVLTGESFDDACEAALEWTAEHDAVFVHPFDHPDIIAGQGTIGLELLEQVPDAATVVVPVGGGGLISGVATAVKARLPSIRVVGVQAAGAASFLPSLTAGEPRALARVATIADGIAVRRPGRLTLAHVQALVDELVTVTDEAIARSVLLLVERAKQVVEPAGAAGLAAVLYPGETSGETPGETPAETSAETSGETPGATPGATSGATLVEPVVVLLCGGNVDPLLLLRIIQSGMLEEGRYLALRTRLLDRPGALSRLLATLAQAGVNVLGVHHQRLGTRLGVLDVEVALEVETRGHGHIREVLDLLRAAGYPMSERA